MGRAALGRFGGAAAGAVGPVALLAALLLLCAGCGATPRLVPMTDRSWFEKSELGFIRAGETTREEILVRLGNPAGRFENDRILTYLVGFEADGKAHVYAPRTLGAPYNPDWDPKVYSLVLVFQPDGVLLKRSLVGSE